MYRDLCPVDLWLDGVDDGREWTCTGEKRAGLVMDMLTALWRVTGIKESKQEGNQDETVTDRAIRNYSEYYRIGRSVVTRQMVSHTRDEIMGWSQLHEALKHYAEHHNRKVETVRINDVIESSKGLRGWAQQPL